MSESIASIKLYCKQNKGEINPWIYGQFLEHICHSVDLGLHAEMLAERSFQLERGDSVYMWQTTCNTTPIKISLSLSSQNPCKGEKCLLMMVNENLNEGEGICQELISICKGDVLDGYIYLRSPIGLGQITVGLRNRDSHQIYDTTVLNGLKPYWQKFPFILSPSASDINAEFFITACKKGQYFIGDVSLMPIKNRIGNPLRDDLLQACKALRPTIIRWPGGCFASIYNWKDAIGPVQERKTHMTHDWGDGGETDPYTFGTDEFITFCHEIGAEPLIVLNITRGVNDALDWMEYCNGSTDTMWGAVRARYGHPEPYNVTCWSIDNEQWYWVMDESAYIDAANEFIGSIRSQYPDIKLWIVGSGQPFEDLDNPFTRATAGPRIQSQIVGKVDYSCYHYYYPREYAEYISLMASNLDLEELFQKEYEKFKESSNITRIAFDEWNPGGIEYKSGLASALLLNSLERISDIVPMAAPALWLRNIRTSADVWNNALINHDHKSWFPSVTYLAMKLWSEHRKQYLIGCEVDCATIFCKRQRRGDKAIIETMETVPLLDVTASMDYNSISVKVVNRSPVNNVDCVVSIEDLPIKNIVSACANVLYSEDLDAVNSLESPTNISVYTDEIRMGAQGLFFSFPKHSAVIIELLLNEQQDYENREDF